MRNYNSNMKKLYKRPPTRYNLEQRAKKIRKAISPIEFYRKELFEFIPTHADDFCKVGFCPFHPTLWGDSFRVHSRLGAYSCRYCGKVGSSIVDFYRQYYGVSLQKAVEDLEKRLGEKKRSK